MQIMTYWREQIITELTNHSTPPAPTFCYEPQPCSKHICPRHGGKSGASIVNGELWSVVS